MRKFGVEIELNSFDQRDFKKDPLAKNEKPEGMDYVFDLLKSNGYEVESRSWQNTHNNDKWICKPDASCGIEICSPVSENLEEIKKVINLLSVDPKIKIDDRCSFHVHMDVSDCIYKNNFLLDFEKSEKLGSILSWWIKCEAVFFDSFPNKRKNNKYCQCIGISDFLSIDDANTKKLISVLGQNKYYSLNTYHLSKIDRLTIEFRLAEDGACLDSDFACNWINLINRFIESSINKRMPSNLCWIDLIEVFDFLNLDNDIILAKWFLNRLVTNINSEINYWKKDFRKRSISELKYIIKKLHLDKEIYCNLFEMDK